MDGLKIRRSFPQVPWAESPTQPCQHVLRKPHPMPRRLPRHTHKWNSRSSHPILWLLSRHRPAHPTPSSGILSRFSTNRQNMRDFYPTRPPPQACPDIQGFDLRFLSRARKTLEQYWDLSPQTSVSQTLPHYHAVATFKTLEVGRPHP